MGFSTTATGPAVTVVNLSDSTAGNAGMELLEQDAMPLQSMPLQAKRVIVRLTFVTVVYHSTNLRVRTRTSVLAACWPTPPLVQWPALRWKESAFEPA
jgi:hypothetical protein